MSDPLTGLRNHRAFQEDLARELQRAGRTGEPVALVLMDVDDLKVCNDTHGHQAGDERLQALAEAIRATQRAADCAYRIGGDEFAVILPAPARSARWSSPSACARETATAPTAPAFTATAGIAEALALRPRRPRPRGRRRAIGAKRVRQDVAIYGPDLEPAARRAPRREDEHHTRTLASALAPAVDARTPTRAATATVAELARRSPTRSA